MPVPFADLQLQYQTIKSEIDGAIANVIRDNAFIRGPYVDAFEREFAEAVEAGHCVSCANGTDALYLAMAALKVKPGDEVITTRTVGIIPVHLYGQPADMDAIMAIAEKHKLWVIEDCAQAHLARYKGHQVGSFGVAATYSFYPGKNLGAMGDAGAVVTGDAALAEHMTMLARHGGLVKHQHRIEGINSRLDGMQAAILSAKLPHLAAWTQARQQAAKIYDEGLNQIEDVVVPEVAPDRTHVYHLYTIRHPRRDALVAHLNANGVQTVVNYPTALPFLAAYRRFGHRAEQFPNAHADQSRIVSLPMFAEITRDQQRTVIDLIRNF